MKKNGIKKLTTIYGEMIYSVHPNSEGPGRLRYMDLLEAYVSPRLLESGSWRSIGGGMYDIVTEESISHIFFIYD